MAAGSGERHVWHMATDPVATIGQRERPTIGRSALHVAQRLLYRSGITRAYASVTRPPQATILMYHSVAHRHHERWIAPGNRVNAEAFDGHCRFLARHRVVLALDDFLAGLDHAKGPPVGATL